MLEPFSRRGINVPQSVDQFAKSLIAAELASADEIKAFWSQIPAGQRPRDDEAFAKLLVAREMLTEFQARELLTGSATPLVLGDYVLLSKIGAGGMGQVFKARHRRMKRDVAIKLLPAALTKDDVAIKRFEREVEVAAKLSHPNIVHAYDASVSRGVWYLVMEYVEGRDLAACIKARGPFAEAEAVRCVLQAARGLEFAHQRGVVHRDIKPHNLLVDRDGVVKILDMGLARLESAGADQDQLTGSGQIMGTIDFMAPEQALDTRSADARSDVYSLGVTLWYLLTGRPLYDADTIMKKLVAHQQAPIPSLRQARPDLAPALEAIFERMVAKSPDDRYLTMRAVIADLERITTDGDEAPTGQFPPTENLRHALSRPEVEAPLGGASRRAAVAPGSAWTNVEATVDLNRSDVDTNARTAEFATAPWIAPVAVTPRSPTGPKTPRSRAWMLGLGGALVAVLSLGVFLLLKSGNGAPRGALDEAAIKDAANPDTATDVVRAPFGTPRTSSPAPAKSPFDTAEANRQQRAWAEHLSEPLEKVIMLPGGEKLTLVLIPPGEFLMGSTAQEQARAIERAKAANDSWADGVIPSEGPRHPVRITRPFYLGKYEVTQAQWQAVTGTNPSKHQDSPTHPVEQVSWEEIQAFLAKLNSAGSAGAWRFDLPTEAQWEFACRAGRTTAYSFGDGDDELPHYAWFKDNGGGRTNPVGQLKPNPFGLYDLHGNVWEWCVDWKEDGYYAKAPFEDPAGPSLGSNRVTRGGGWDFDATHCRSAFRLAFVPSHRWMSCGFRLALVPSGASAESGSRSTK